MSELERLWREHLEAPYPNGYRGEEVEGIDLVELDAAIAGCVSTYLAEAGHLDLQRTDVLRDCCWEAHLVVSKLPSPARDYFARLERMSTIVLELLRANQRAV
jgi:hypothetical protein